MKVGLRRPARPSRLEDEVEGVVAKVLTAFMPHRLHQKMWNKQASRQKNAWRRSLPRIREQQPAVRL